MNKRDILFTITFIFSLTVLLYYLGASITGYVTQSMYCEEGVCREFCRSDYDCDTNEICCQKEDFGVCESSSDCEERYAFQPSTKGIQQITAIPESPSPEGSRICLYLVLVLLAVFIGVIYFLRRKKYLT